MTGIQIESVIRNINNPSASSSLTAIYSLNLIAKGEVLELGDVFNTKKTVKKNKKSKKTGVETKSSKKNKTLSVSKKEKKQGTIREDEPLTYVMTYGKLGISPDGKTIYFPFLSKIDIKIMEINALQSINGIAWQKAGLTEAVDVSYKNKDGVKQTNTGSRDKKMFNCLVTIEFSIPAILQNNPSYNYAMVKLALSRDLYAKEFTMNYLHDSEKFIITDLTSFDFDSEAFNPINSSGFEDLQFSRKFVGYANVVDINKRKKARSKRKSKQYKSDEEWFAKKKTLSNLPKKEQIKAYKAHLAELKKFKRLEYQYKAGNPSSNIPLEEETPTDYQEKQDGYNYIVSFIPYNIDFKKVYLAEDSAMEGSGLVQVLSVLDEVKNIGTVDYNTFDVKLVTPSGRPATNISARELNGSKIANDKMSIVDYDEGGDEMASSYHETFNSELLGKANPRAFNLTISLPRAILRAEIFQDILIYGSRFGIYDGYWRIFEVDLAYEENGQITQELKIKPKVLTDTSKKKKKAVTLSDVADDSAK